MNMVSVPQLILSAVCLSLGHGQPEQIPQMSLRVVGGHSIDISEAPYVASYQFESYHYCGAFIISESFLLTAAHCNSKEDMTVRVGSSETTEGGQVVKVKRWENHPKTKDADYDVGLIELEEPLQFNEKVKAISIATKEPEEGENATVSGWGEMQGHRSEGIVLQAVTIPIVGRKACEESYPEETITPRMICGGETGKGPCYGDSGSILAVGSTAVGVVSWGSPHCGDDTPGVYTNLADPEVRQFIKDVAKV